MGKKKILSKYYDMYHSSSGREVTYNVFQNRMKLGWSLEDALRKNKRKRPKKAYIPSEKTLVEMGFKDMTESGCYTLMLPVTTIWFNTIMGGYWMLGDECNIEIYPHSKAHLESIILAFKKPIGRSDTQ